MRRATIFGLLSSYVEMIVGCEEGEVETILDLEFRMEVGSAPRPFSTSTTGNGYATAIL